MCLAIVLAPEVFFPKDLDLSTLRTKFEKHAKQQAMLRWNQLGIVLENGCHQRFRETIIASIAFYVSRYAQDARQQ